MSSNAVVRSSAAVARQLVRFRYLVMAVVGGLLATFLVRAQGPHPVNDWLVFESAARVLVHYHHLLPYDIPRFRLYADLPAIQIGPPAIWPVAALQWLTPFTVSRIFVGLMMVLGVAAIAACERAASSFGGVELRRRIAFPAAVGGCIVIVDWAWCVVHWHHLDDVLALSLIAIVCFLIGRGGPWWLVGLLVGTAVAAKPWAIVMTPVLMGLDRQVRARTVLVALVSAAAWWAPFVIGGPGTIQALGGYHIEVADGSVLRLLSITGDVQRWLRPVQFIGGAVAAYLVARRGGRAWLAAPLAGLAVRVLTDPYVWGYYGMGPILFALLWDLACADRRRVPLYTLLTAGVEGLLPRLADFNLVGPPSAQAYLASSFKMLWGISVLAALAIELRRYLRVGAPGEGGDDAPGGDRRRRLSLGHS